MLIKSQFNEYVHANHVIAVKVAKNGENYTIRIYTKSADILGVYKDADECNAQLTRIYAYLGTYCNWVKTHGYIFKMDAIESINANSNNIVVSIAGQEFTIACKDEADVESALNEIELGFCGAVHQM